MRRLFTTLVGSVAVLLATNTAYAQNYQQVWADEFNGSSVNTANWKFETGNNNGWGNNEKQYYQAANATVANGVLSITARKQSVGGVPYTSARMKTLGLREFKYGKVEARIKVPLAQGLLPAFWMLGNNRETVGWPYCGEIDVMEQVNTASRCYGSTHWYNTAKADYSGSVAVTANTYHVYSIEWTPSYIRWFVDGAKYLEFNISNGVGGTGEFQRPFYVLLSMAVAGDWPGQTVDQSKLPATMSVDYIRVYQLAGARTALAMAPADASPVMSVYPNPVINQLTIEALPELLGEQMSILSAEGREVWHGVYQGEAVDVAALKPGLYTLTIYVKGKTRLIKRFSKE